MKYYILLIYLLAFSLATEGNTAVKDSLSEALPSASSPLQKLEIMTNLMDLSRQEEQVPNSSIGSHLKKTKTIIRKRP